MRKLDFKWMKERIPYLKHGNWLYKIMCFLCGERKEKMTYEEYFLVVYGVNKKKLGDKEAKLYALETVVDIYIFLHNGDVPEGISEYYGNDKR